MLPQPLLPCEGPQGGTGRTLFFRIERSSPPDGGPARVKLCVNPDPVPEQALGWQRDSNDSIAG